MEVDRILLQHESWKDLRWRPELQLPTKTDLWHPEIRTVFSEGSYAVLKLAWKGLGYTY